MDKLILWDFDGTLAERSGGWTSCMLEVLDELEPGHEVGADDVRPHLRSGFPWHLHSLPHPELNDPEAWWEKVGRTLIAAFAGVGFSFERSKELTKVFRQRLVAREGWTLFAGVENALDTLQVNGWRHAIVSNHVPELHQIVDFLGLGKRFEAVFSSAITGYEKPHPEAFRFALEALGGPARVWMVGDNPIADVAGAEKLRIPAILVRTDLGDEDLRRRIDESWGGSGWEDWPQLVKRTAPDLSGAAKIILEG